MMSRSNRLLTARHVIDIYKELLRSLGVTPGPHRFHLSVPERRPAIHFTAAVLTPDRRFCRPESWWWLGHKELGPGKLRTPA